MNFETNRDKYLATERGRELLKNKDMYISEINELKTKHLILVNNMKSTQIDFEKFKKQSDLDYKILLSKNKEYCKENSDLQKTLLQLNIKYEKLSRKNQYLESNLVELSNSVIEQSFNVEKYENEKITLPIKAEETEIDVSFRNEENVNKNLSICYEEIDNLNKKLDETNNFIRYENTKRTEILQNLYCLFKTGHCNDTCQVWEKICNVHLKQNVKLDPLPSYFEIDSPTNDDILQLINNFTSQISNVLTQSITLLVYICKILEKSNIFFDFKSNQLHIRQDIFGDCENLPLFQLLAINKKLGAKIGNLKLNCINSTPEINSREQYTLKQLKTKYEIEKKFYNSTILNLINELKSCRQDVISATELKNIVNIKLNKNVNKLDVLTRLLDNSRDENNSLYKYSSQINQEKLILKYQISKLKNVLNK
ncbi:hypothetical protein A3Q56_01090 [Intoshia linei]|uniref:Uncharacterized protein n=1 Tax=Intoshia linei TaxID=1819745 RepID=A0A177BBW2_9BILA|nr:hypothetical protein A3Q56_01090 [Intoshia linei]